MDEAALYQVRKRIRKGISRVREVAIEFREIAERLTLPTPGEYQEMACFEAEASYEVYLAGLLGAIRSHLLEVGLLFQDHMVRITPKTYNPHLDLTREILEYLGKEVGYRQGTAAYPESVKGWDREA